MLKHIIIAAFFLINGALAINPVKAEIAVIVHPNAAFELNEDEIIRIFLGKDQFFPENHSLWWLIKR